MPQLHVKHVRFDVKINDDSGSRARRNLATWRPHLEDGWYYLGPAANNGGAGGCDGVIIKAANDTPALVPITSWVKVWSDAGSGNRVDYALWKGLPALEHRTDYTVVGGFFTRHSDAAGPSKGDEASGMAAVHKDCLVTVQAGGQIWNDAGTRAKQDGSVWGISGAGYLQAVETGGFVPADGHNTPPMDTYGLDRDRIVREMYYANTQGRNY